MKVVCRSKSQENRADAGKLRLRWSAALGLAAAAFVSGSALAATPVSFREYIYSNVSGAGPIFNTGVYPNKTTRIVMTFKKDKTSGNQIFFGVRGGGFEFVNFTDATDGTMMSFRFGNSTQHTINPTGYTIGEKATLDFGPAGAFLDGRQLVSAASLAGSANDKTSSRSLALFTVQDGQYDQWSRGWQGYCYDFKVYQGDSCVLHYYPCLDSDGTACFYDAVSKSLVYRATDYTTPAYNKGTLTLSANERDDIRLNDGTVEFKVSAVSGDARFGSVTGTSGWYAVGASVPLTATPEPGCTFVRWEGDVDAITSGTPTDTTVTVKPTVKAVSLKAVFSGMCVKDGTLYVFVLDGETCTDDYTSLLAGVTNVVKAGAGALRLKANSSFTGDWHVEAGEVQFHDAYSFGSASAGNVYVASGATLFALPAPSSDALKGKHVYIEGIGTQKKGETLSTNEQDGIRNPDRMGVLVGPSRSSNGAGGWNNNGNYTLKNVRWHLTGDATYWQPNRPMNFDSGTIDAAGHVFTLTGSGGGGNIFLSGSEVVTNSTATPARIEICGSGMKNHVGAVTFGGGSQNVIDARSKSYPLSVEGVVNSDWTLLMGGGVGMGGNSDQANPDGTSRVWNGPIVFEGKTQFYVHDSQGYTLNLKGSIASDADASWVVTRGHSLNVHSTNNTFAGTIEVNSKNGGTYVSRLKMCKDSVFSAKSLTLDSANFVMDGETAFAIAPTTVKAGDCSVSGGAEGTTISSVTQQGTGTLTLDTPAIIGELNVTSGMVVLSSLPEVTKLVTATGATLDLGGQVLTVDSFEGDPSVVVNGKVFVCKSFTVPPGSVIDTNVFDWSEAGLVCVKPAGPLDASTYPGAYVTGDIDVTTVWGQMAPGDYATFTKRVIAEGEHAGQTLVEMTVTKTPPTATWSATLTGGAWNNAANWNGATPPTAAAVTFPKAEAAEVPVNADLNATLYGLTVQTGAGESDWLTPFGYAYAGTALWLLGSDEVTFSFAAGQNTVDVPFIGMGTLKIDTALYPLTNVTGAAYSKTTVSEKSLERFTGTLAVNPAKRPFNGRTELGTAKFTGKMSVSGGEVKLDSVAFVKSREDLLIEGETTFAYTGDDVTIPGLTWNVSRGDVNVVAGATLSVGDFYTKTTSSALFKTGLGVLKVGGTATMTFTGSNNGTGTDKGFSSVLNLVGRPSWGRYRPINVCQGTLEVGTVGDATSAPTVNVSGDLALGNHEVPTKAAKLVVNNGEVNVSGTLWLPYYTLNEEDDALRSVVVNGGSFHAAKTDARIGYVVSDGKPYGRQVFEVNGGSFKIDGNFNLTQLCPSEGNGGKSQYQSSMTHTFTVNGGTAEVGCFRMGYSYGLTWDGKTSDNNGYGHGWQPDAYLTVNGGVMTVNDYLLTTDRKDSRSWTALNGGVLKVNMISNTVGTAASTYLTFNGGTLAPIGDGDKADELQLKADFTAAVVSTNGAIVTTAYLPSGKAYVIRQALVHDAALDGADGGLVKRGEGTLELAGANTFTGPVTVEGGTLVFADRTSLLSKANAVTLAKGTKLGLRSGKVKVASLTVDGRTLPDGIYGSKASGAPETDDALFEGVGQLQVGKVGLVLIVR